MIGLIWAAPNLVGALRMNREARSDTAAAVLDG